ncbi:hypothetical protein MHB42_09335 [Lysinibacillus sp. FSL K6-0232]|uniref:hypothetical protein n=1 Tax=unclassified Lysinibacillus TaxID=2636778 RepID=UPI0030F9F345
MKKTIVSQVDQHTKQPCQQMIDQRQTLSANTFKLSQQQIHEMMQVIEEIRLKGFKETL